MSLSISVSPKSSENLRGILWMTLAMALFALEDALVKRAAESMPSGQMILSFGLGGALVFLWAVIARGEPVFAAVGSSVMRLRMVLEILGRMFYFLALALTPLSSTTAILQATPLVVVAGAAIFFGERVAIARWIAIGIGLLGVLIILQPSGEQFSPLSLLAVLGMMGFAGRDLASRAAPMSLSTFVLGFYGFVAVMISGLLVSGWSREAYVIPETVASVALIAGIAVGVCAYIALMQAMRTGEVSVVTPFRYSRLIFGVSLGYFVFAEPLSSSFWFGSFVVVAAGLSLMLQGPKRH
ncbi:MAG TPA: DMT family transporter [Marinobacterium sp.]|nr:DMT family transporter [Marinobacterium sp.]